MCFLFSLQIMSIIIILQTYFVSQDGCKTKQPLIYQMTGSNSWIIKSITAAFQTLFQYISQLITGIIFSKYKIYIFILYWKHRSSIKYNSIFDNVNSPLYQYYNSALLLFLFRFPWLIFNKDLVDNLRFKLEITENFLKTA